MEDKIPFIKEAVDFKNALEEAESNPVQFFENSETKYDIETLSSLLSCFLNTSENYNLLKETILKINSLKNEQNIDDLIDFLMTNRLNKKEDFDIVNLKALCIGAISNLKNEKGIPALLYCLNNKNENYKLRFKAAEALGNIGDKKAVDSLINIVTDEEEKSVYVRESAATALGLIGDIKAVEAFLGVLETKKGFLGKFTFLKERIIEALGKISYNNTARSIAVFKNALMDESPQVRINAIECLMNSECEEAYDIIKTKLEDSDPEVVQNAVIALYNLKGREALFEILKNEKMNEVAKEEANNLYAEYEENEE